MAFPDGCWRSHDYEAVSTESSCVDGCVCPFAVAERCDLRSSDQRVRVGRVAQRVDLESAGRGRVEVQRCDRSLGQ